MNDFTTALLMNDVELPHQILSKTEMFTAVAASAVTIVVGIAVCLYFYNKAK